jgi:hypothetical protein
MVPSTSPDGGDCRGIDALALADVEQAIMIRDSNVVVPILIYAGIPLSQEVVGI